MTSFSSCSGITMVVVSLVSLFSTLLTFGLLTGVVRSITASSLSLSAVRSIIPSLSMLPDKEVHRIEMGDLTSWLPSNLKTKMPLVSATACS